MKNLFALIVAAFTVLAATHAEAVPAFDMRVVAGTQTLNFTGTINPGGMTGAVATVPAGVLNFGAGPAGSRFQGGAAANGPIPAIPAFFADFEINNGQIKMAVGFQSGTNLPNGGTRHAAAGAGSYQVMLSLSNISAGNGTPVNWVNSFTGNSLGAGVGSPNYPISNIAVYLDPSNTAFNTTGGTQLLFSNSYSAVGPFALNDTLENFMLPNTQYSMTAVVTIDFPLNSLNARNDFRESLTGTQVPEPASLALLASGLLGAGLALRRRKKGAKTNTPGA